MSSQALFRWAAGALAISAISLPIGVILHPTPPPFSGATVASTQWAASHFFFWLGAMAGIPGLAGLYLRQRHETGLAGFIGSALAVLGCALIACAMYFEAFIVPFLAAEAPDVFRSFPAGGGWEGFLAGVLASGALFGAGFLVFGIAMLRAALMPRWAILAAVAGGIPFAVNFLLPHMVAILAAVVFGAGLFALAYTLWHRTPQLAEASA